MALPEKEGGFGWLVTGASFWVHFVTCGIAYSCGLFHLFYRDEYNQSHFETSWISSLILALSVLAGIPSLVLTYQIGVRFTVMIGGVLACIGFVLTYFVNHLYEVYLTLGGVVGIGFGIALTPSVLITQSYFYKKSTTASCIVSSGVSVGIFAFPLVLHKLEEAIGIKNMSLVLAGISLTISAAAVLMVPKSDVGKRKDYVKMFKPILFKSIAFNCIIISNFIWSFGMAIIYSYLPEYVMKTGLMTRFDAAMLLAVTGMSAFTSRVIFTIFSQSAKLDHCSTFLCTIVLTLILTALFPELFKHKAGEIGYGLIFGMHCGYWSIFVGGVSEELIGHQYMGYVKGYIVLSIGLGLFAGPPIAGWTYDHTEDLEIAFYLAGACMLFSSVMMMVVSMKKFYFMNYLDWSDEISVSSQGSRATTSNQCHTAEDSKLVVDCHLSTV